MHPYMEFRPFKMEEVMGEFRATISMPCYLRVKSTQRALECILSQTAAPFEAIAIWDGCPYYHTFEPFLAEMKIAMESKGNAFVYFNTEHSGGYGYKQVNWAIKNARGKYFLTLGNDDYIEPNHIEHYLSGIEGTDFDIVCFDTFLVKYNCLRVAGFVYGSAGDQEIIVKTEFRRKVPERGTEYASDWTGIENMIRAGAKLGKGGGKPTYYVANADGPGGSLETMIP